jgi:hypothetical protein
MTTTFSAKHLSHNLALRTLLANIRDIYVLSLAGILSRKKESSPLHSCANISQLDTEVHIISDRPCMMTAAAHRRGCGCVVGEDDVVGNARANNRRVGAIREVVILHTSNQGLTCSVQKEYT